MPTNYVSGNNGTQTIFCAASAYAITALGGGGAGYASVGFMNGGKGGDGIIIIRVALL